jgi:hypothetical protein
MRNLPKLVYKGRTKLDKNLNEFLHKILNGEFKINQQIIGPLYVAGWNGSMSRLKEFLEVALNYSISENQTYSSPSSSRNKLKAIPKSRG